MTLATSIDANHPRTAAATISDWSFDRLVGRISARDQWGNLVMTFAADPQFGQRLAAAFNSTPGGTCFVERSTPGETRFVERRQQPAARRQMPPAVSLSSMADSWRHAAVPA